MYPLLFLEVLCFNILCLVFNTEYTKGTKIHRERSKVGIGVISLITQAFC